MATTFNFVPGVNLINYDNSAPTLFSTLNPTVNIKIIKTPAFDTSPAYSNLQSYIPNSSLNRWLTAFQTNPATNNLSAYLVDAKVAFSFTPAGDNVTTPQNITVTAPWGIIGLDSNRTPVSIAPYGPPISPNGPIGKAGYATIYRTKNGAWYSYVFGSGLNPADFQNFEPNTTYYIYASAQYTPWTLAAPRIKDVLLTDSDGFIQTENGFTLTVE